MPSITRGAPGTDSDEAARQLCARACEEQHDVETLAARLLMPPATVG
jgi:hypothetical protein